MSNTKTAVNKQQKQKINRPVTHFGSKNVRLYCGDVIETLNHFPDNCVDLIFVDPPYNLSNGGFTCHAGKRVSVNKGKWDKSKGLQEDFQFHFSWLEACRRVLKDNGTLWVSGTYHSIYACGYAMQLQGWHILNDICWYKPNAAPHLACRMFAASHESILWARKTKQAKHYFDYELAKNKEWESDFMKKENRQMRSVWAINTPKPYEKRYGKHPTQKPELLLERIVLTCSRPKDIILDPFCGSATTGVAALANNRKFVGIDAEPSYLDNYAIPRINDVINEKTKTKATLFAEKNKVYGLLP